MSLCLYDTAIEIKKRLLVTPLFVRITKGIKINSIAQILDIEHINYRTHNYVLRINNQRKFTVSGKNLELLENYKGETKLEIANEPPKILDFLGKEIKIGCIVIFPRTIKSQDNVNSEVVIVSICKIQLNGTIYAKPIKVGLDTSIKHNPSMIRVRQPEKALIIDTTTINRIMFYKLVN